MAQTVTLPRQDIAIAGTQPASREWYRWAFDITTRVGGVQGPGTDDLAAASFEDAGVEESRALLFSAVDAANQAPDQAQALQALARDNERLSEEVAELRAIVFELYKSIQGISQGVIQ